jgi:hypothetical protein
MLKKSFQKRLRTIGGDRPSRGRSWMSAAGALVALASTPSHAAYNANLSGYVTQILTYNSGIVMFSLDTQPTSNGSCAAAFFELDPASTPNDPASAVTNAAAFNRMYARLLEAYTLGQPVNIGYDNAGNCSVLGYITTYRIG